jgi:hypothetical protein
MMQKKIVTKWTLASLVCMCVVFLVSIATVEASISGGIDSNHKVTRVCQDNSCSTFGTINFAPTINVNTPGAIAISITDSGIAGNAWGDEIGWVNFTPIGGGVAVDPSTGVLSGLAYSSVGSWINFSPTGQGVTLVDNGSGSDFFGYAWVSGIRGGWIKFDCSQNATCIKTDWRSIPNRTVIPPSGGGSTSTGTRTRDATVNTDSSPTPTSTDTAVVLPKDPSLTFPQPPLSIGDKEKSSVQSFPNTFDTNGDGLPDSIPPNQTNQNTSAYQQLFPLYSNQFKQKSDCIFCVVMRHDVLSTNAGGKDRSIVKFAFIPQKIEIRIPFSNLSNTIPKSLSRIPDVDGTSIALAILVSVAIWKVFLVRALAFLR